MLLLSALLLFIEFSYFFFFFLFYRFCKYFLFNKATILELLRPYVRP